MTAWPRRILLLGGTGFVGRSVCERLVERDADTRITVATRRLSRARAVQFLPTVDPVQCDVHDDAQLTRLVAGHDAVIQLIAILHGSADAFDRVHVQLPRTLAAACGRAGVQRVVHVSALGVPDRAAGDAPSDYLRSKAAGEAVWQQALAATGGDLTILRPSVIFGADDRFTNLFARLQRLLPVLPLAGAGARFQPVWVGDVAQAVLLSLQQRPGPGPVVECAGPQVLTLAEIVQRVGTMAGCRRPVLPLPEAAGLLQAAAMGLLPGEPLMSRDNLLSMRVPNVASGRLPGLRDLGLTPQAIDILAPHFRPADPRAR